MKYNYGTQSKVDGQGVLFLDDKYQNLFSNNFAIHNRRYIGNKQKLLGWIFSVIENECNDVEVFTDLFAGTGVVSARAANQFSKIVLNDSLFSNEVIYKAFFGYGKFNQDKINEKLSEYNELNSSCLAENYFSRNFGGKYFSPNIAKKIGFIREDLTNNKDNLNNQEFNILLTSLLYASDKIANTVGHYDAYRKGASFNENLELKSIQKLHVNNLEIYRQDANELAKRISSDIVYIDPPYNSRQYCRFYHVLENLSQWKKPELHGVALKPEADNMSDYCRNNAKDKLADLIANLKTKYIVLSYNNTYKSKSNSSKNKITLSEIENILNKKGSTKSFSQSYKHFNTGNTDFDDHKEYLFVTKVNE